MNDTNLTNNLSTIAVWVWVIVSPYIADYFTQDQFTTLFVAIIGLIIAVYSSYNPNTFKFLGNDNTCTCNNETCETVMNDEYVYEDIVDDEGGC